MADFLPPVIVELLADGREFKKTMAEAGGQLEVLGDKAKTTSEKLSSMGSKFATGYLTVVGGALIYGTKLAFDYQKSIEDIGLQSGASAEEVDRLKKAVMDQSNLTVQSTKDIAAAYMEVEKAKISGAAADAIVNAAGKAANITGGKTVDIAKSIIGVQTLQVAKGMDVASIADIMVNANKRHLGSLESLTAGLTGKVGAALALHNVGLKDSIAITDELSNAQFTNSRAINTFATSIGKLEAPNKGMLDTMKKLGVSSDVVRRTMAGPDGLVNTLSYLASVASKTGQGTGSLSSALFGGGAGAANVLIANASKVQDIVKGLGGSGKDLNSQFGGFLKLPDAQIKQFKTTLSDALTSVGLVILPVAEKVLGWVNGFATKLKDNAALRTALEITVGAGFAASLAMKIKGVFDSVKSLFTGTAITANTAAETLNTAALEANTLAQGGKTAESLIPKVAKLAVIADTVASVASGAGATALLPAVAATGGLALLANYASTHAGPAETYAQGTGAIPSGSTLGAQDWTKEVIGNAANHVYAMVPTIVATTQIPLLMQQYAKTHKDPKAQATELSALYVAAGRFAQQHPKNPTTVILKLTP